jgi:hypothetical protein
MDYQNATSGVAQDFDWDAAGYADAYSTRAYANCLFPSKALRHRNAFSAICRRGLYSTTAAVLKCGGSTADAAANKFFNKAKR